MFFRSFVIGCVALGIGACSVSPLGSLGAAGLASGVTGPDTPKSCSSSPWDNPGNASVSVDGGQSSPATCARVYEFASSGSGSFWGPVLEVDSGSHTLLYLATEGPPKSRVYTFDNRDPALFALTPEQERQLESTRQYQSEEEHNDAKKVSMDLNASLAFLDKSRFPDLRIWVSGAPTSTKGEVLSLLDYDEFQIAGKVEITAPKATGDDYAYDVDIVVKSVKGSFERRVKISASAKKLSDKKVGSFGSP